MKIIYFKHNDYIKKTFIHIIDSGVPPGASMWPPSLPGATPSPHHAGVSPYSPNPLLSTPHHHHAAAAAAAHAHAATLQQQQQHSLPLSTDGSGQREDVGFNSVANKSSPHTVPR